MSDLHSNADALRDGWGDGLPPEPAEYETTLTVRFTARDDDAARDEVDTMLACLEPLVESVTILPPVPTR